MENKIEIYLVVFFASFLLFFAAVIILFIQYRSRQKAVHKEKELRQQLHTKEMISAKMEIQQQTMQHIGREIHDNVGQQLTLAALYTQQLDYENSIPQEKLKIQNIGNIINHSLAELRRLSKTLTDDLIAENSITLLLETECNKVRELKKCAVEFDHEKFSGTLSYQTKNILLRIVQEFIQNSIKYAQCRTISLKLSSTESFAILHINDDGIGFIRALIKESGIGINNMKKRTEMIGGSFSLLSEPGKGTSLTIEIPVL